MFIYNNYRDLWQCLSVAHCGNNLGLSFVDSSGELNKMAGCRYAFQRCLLVLFLLLSFAIEAECRGSRGGGSRGGSRSGGFRGGSSYRSAGYRGGSGGGSGGASAGMIVGIVFGVIGGSVAIVVAIFLIKKFCCDASSSSASSGGVKYHTEGSIATTTPAFKTSSIPPYDDSGNNAQEKSQLGDASFASYPVSPPSYNSAVSGAEGSLPYNPVPGYVPTPEYTSASYPQPPSASPYFQNPPSAPLGFDSGAGFNADRKND